ncbi:orotidine 5'-phosphate decarboxylase isoform X1 [Carex rostrata]
MPTPSMSYISISPYTCNTQILYNKLCRPCCASKMHNISSFKFDFARPWSHGMWRSLSDCASTRNHLLHRFHINASSDEDFKSSRNIAISLFKRYRNVIDRGGGENLKEFINAGVNAYALGCTDEGLRKELINLKESGTEIEGLQIYGGGTSVKFKILYEEDAGEDSAAGTNGSDGECRGTISCSQSYATCLQHFRGGESTMAKSVVNLCSSPSISKQHSSNPCQKMHLVVLLLLV